MAAFAAGRGLVRLVRNHERGAGTPFSGAALRRCAGGGTTTIVFDSHKGEVVAAARQHQRHHPQLRRRADAVGHVADLRGNRPHRRSAACRTATSSRCPRTALGDPQPLRDMGRYSHEAVAVDPATGYVYETEDAGNSSGFYRFVPNTPGRSRGGRRAVHAQGRRREPGEPYGRLSPTARPTTSSGWRSARRTTRRRIARQLRLGAGTGAGRGDVRAAGGRWYGNDAKIYIVSTSGGGSARGQVWEYIAGRGDAADAVPVARPRGPQRAGQHLREPARRSGALRRRQRRGVHARPDGRRRDLPLRQEHRRRWTASATASSATSADRSGRAPATAPMASGSSANLQSPGISFGHPGAWMVRRFINQG